MKNLLLLDDHMVIRAGLKSLLQDFYSNLQFHEASNEEEFLQVLKKQRIDLAVMDLQIPNVDVISLIEMTSIRYPGTYILIFSMLPQKIYARRVFKAGASGYLPKESSTGVIREAFDLALLSKKYMSTELAAFLKEDEKSEENLFDKLSHREFLIVNLLLNGQSITSIARQLNIKPSTVGTYKTRVFEKLKVKTIFELKELALLYEVGSYA